MIKREFASYRVKRVEMAHGPENEVVRISDGPDKPIGEIRLSLNPFFLYSGKYYGPGKLFTHIYANSFDGLLDSIVDASETELEQQWKALQQAMESEGVPRRG